MPNSKKLLQAAAGAAAGAGGVLNVEDVFSAHVYEGNGSAEVIENDINLGQSNSGGSVDFSHSNGTFVSVPASSDFGFGTGDYTVEFFVYKIADKNYNTFYDHRTSTQTATSLSPFLYTDSGGTLYFYLGGDNRISGTGTSLAAGAWSHVALCRGSGSTRLFVNGTQIGSTYSDSNNYVTPASSWSFGGSSEQNQYNVEGYMSNLRVVKGSALYTGDFTTPTSALTAVSGTVLLTLQGDDPFVDNSSSSHALSNNEDKAVDFKLGPFDAAGAGEGGLVWIKSRTSTTTAFIYDTEGGTGASVTPSDTNARETDANTLTTFNSNGFSVGPSGKVNSGSNDYASWTFRKAPGFCDVQTWTGDGVAGRTVSHNLGSVPGMVIVKRTDAVGSWVVYHRGLNGGTNPEEYYIILNAGGGEASATTIWNDTAPTASVLTLGSAAAVNNHSGATYVGYFFAHHDADGEFGPDSDKDIIKCGGYSGNGTDKRVIDLGFEAQWLLIKRRDSTQDWHIFDNMRGLPDRLVSASIALKANATSLESSVSNLFYDRNGFMVDSGDFNSSGEDYIYMAIRRGPTAVPTSAADVFDISTRTANLPSFDSKFPVDMGLIRKSLTSAGGIYNSSRIMSTKFLYTNGSDAEANDNGFVWDFMDGWANDGGDNSNVISWMWRRAPNYFDVVAYGGNSTGGTTINHSLGVAPEMMWVKKRNVPRAWKIYHSGTGNGKAFEFNTEVPADSPAFWNDTTPTETVFSLGSSETVNGTGDTYIAYLFATLDGISKVGSFSGDGSAGRVIDCGFSNGARFVLIRSSSNADNWFLFDTVQGILAGDDPYLRVNTNDSQVTNADLIDAHSSGFIVNNANGDLNDTGRDYIFYAIA